MFLSIFYINFKVYYGNNWKKTLNYWRYIEIKTNKKPKKLCSFINEYFKKLFSFINDYE